MPSPSLSPYSIEDAPKGRPQITELHYDVWTLRITLDFEDWDGAVYLDFESPAGFRVMEEGDLQEVWQDKNTTKHWLHVVESGGWLALESSREGFTQEASELREFFVAGVSDCVSVLAFDDPVITVVGGE